MNFFFCR